MDPTTTRLSRAVSFHFSTLSTTITCHSMSQSAGSPKPCACLRETSLNLQGSLSDYLNFFNYYYYLYMSDLKIPSPSAKDEGPNKATERRDDCEVSDPRHPER